MLPSTRMGYSTTQTSTMKMGDMEQMLLRQNRRLMLYAVDNYGHAESLLPPPKGPRRKEVHGPIITVTEAPYVAGSTAWPSMCRQDGHRNRGSAQPGSLDRQARQSSDPHLHRCWQLPAKPRQA